MNIQRGHLVTKTESILTLLSESGKKYVVCIQHIGTVVGNWVHTFSLPQKISISIST